MRIEFPEHAPREANIERVADGDAEFCITSVKHYLSARALLGEVPARFVAVIGQRSTIGCLVPWDSTAREAADLAGSRLGGDPDSPLVQSFQAGLRWLGYETAELVASDDPAQALARGEAEVIAATVDTVRRNERRSGLRLRAIPLNVDIYMSGLVAADDVPAHFVRRLVSGIRSALQQQRENPKAGLSQLLGRHPEVDAEDAVEGWSAVEPFIFTDVPLLSMTAAGWQRAVSHISEAHDLPNIDVESVYRPEFLRAP